MATQPGPPRPIPEPSAGLLRVVATPIGNLADLSPRARDVLASADLVLCEDTRHTGHLLQHLGLRKPLRSLHAHNEEQQIPGVLDELRRGAQVALVSDAGTPCLSDPGARLVEAVHAAGLRVETVPGPFAVAAGLAASGLQPVPFAFWGFLAKKQGERRAQLDARLQPAPEGGAMSHAFYVPGRDLREVLADLVEVAPASRVVVARELTKVHEAYLRGQPAQVAAALPDEMLRGEAVLLVEITARSRPRDAVAEDPAALVQAAREQGLDRKQALAALGKRTGLSRKALYELWIRAGEADGAQNEPEPEA